MTAYADDWSGGLARTRGLPNNAVGVEVLGAGEAPRATARSSTAAAAASPEGRAGPAGERD